MTSSQIDLLVSKFNTSSELTEVEHTSIRNSSRFNYVHFNGRCFKIGFNGNDCTFLVTNYQKNVLLKLNSNWVLKKDNIGDELFLGIQYKLYKNFYLFFEFQDSIMIKLPEEKILYLILKNFLIRQNGSMAIEEDIMSELKKYHLFRDLKFKDLDAHRILPRLCAGKNESYKYHYFYNDGTINDISLLDRKMSVKKYIKYLEKSYHGQISLVTVVRNFHSMYPGFKVHTVIGNWHLTYGYNLNFEVCGSDLNLIFEKFLYNALQKLFRSNAGFFEVPNQIITVYKNNSLMWLINNVFEYAGEQNSVHKYNFRYKIIDESLNIYGRTNLIVLLPYVFKNLFLSFDEVNCYGDEYVYKLKKYKKIYQLKFEKL